MVRCWLALSSVVVCALAGGKGMAQSDPEGQVGAGPAPPADVIPLPPPVLTLDQERLFRESAWGRAAIARAEAEGAALSQENRRIDEALEREERELTERRAGMKAADFAALASQFDVKVEEIRTAQDGKARAINRHLEEDRQRFFEVVTPILGDLLAETGAAAILANSAIVMSLASLDITSTAIQRVDAVLPPPEAVPAPAPDETPAPAPGEPPPLAPEN